jgi:serine/threonine-protein kinase
MGSEPSAESSPDLPSKIGAYIIERELGRGGMGAVYVGAHDVIGKRAAVKVLLAAASRDDNLVKRFINEARAASQIHHPGIVEVFDYGTDDGRAFIVMELLEGSSLAARMKAHGRLAIPTAVDIARQVAEALAAAHAAGIVHRDLKPDNIFLVPDGDRDRVVLLDWGSRSSAASAPRSPVRARSPARCSGRRSTCPRSSARVAARSTTAATCTRSASRSTRC